MNKQNGIVLTKFDGDEEFKNIVENAIESIDDSSIETIEMYFIFKNIYDNNKFTELMNSKSELELDWEFIHPREGHPCKYNGLRFSHGQVISDRLVILEFGCHKSITKVVEWEYEKIKEASQDNILKDTKLLKVSDKLEKLTESEVQNMTCCPECGKKLSWSYESPRSNVMDAICCNRIFSTVPYIMHTIKEMTDESLDLPKLKYEPIDEILLLGYLEDRRLWDIIKNGFIRIKYRDYTNIMTIRLNTSYTKCEEFSVELLTSRIFENNIKFVHMHNSKSLVNGNICLNNTYFRHDPSCPAGQCSYLMDIEFISKVEPMEVTEFNFREERDIDETKN